jgi:hypothetical protein
MQWCRSGAKDSSRRGIALFRIVSTEKRIGNPCGWGFTPQKPIKKAYEQRPEAVRQWLDQERILRLEWVAERRG